MKHPRIFEAIEFAAKAHAGQFRKGTEVPYLLHPLMVAKILIDCGCAEDVVIAGILHDTIEDTAVTVQDIQGCFGDAVAQLVVEASEPDKSDSWENRKQHTIEHLKTCSRGAVLVEVADKLDNIRNIHEDYGRHGAATWARFKRSQDHQRWYYQGLAEAFTARCEGDPLDALVEEFAMEVQKVFGPTLRS